MAADEFAGARALAKWRASVTEAWPAVAVLHVESQLAGGVDAQLGGSLALRAEIALGGLTPDDVLVEVVYGAADADDRLADISTRPLRVVEQVDGVVRYEGEVPLERTGGFGYTVRVLPTSELLASSAELGVVATA
jgi:starch phosphorylase